MKIYTYDYNRHYIPAAPFLDIVVSSEFELALSVALTAQVDSGADATMLPLSLLKQIQAEYEDTQIMITASGQREVVDLYAAKIEVVEQIFYLSVVALKGEQEAIIGRDVLNDLKITLNGPANTTEIIVDE